MVREFSLTLLDFISIDDILAKISEAARTKGTIVLEIPEQISVAEVVQILFIMF